MTQRQQLLFAFGGILGVVALLLCVIAVEVHCRTHRPFGVLCFWASAALYGSLTLILEAFRCGQ